jgi:hypothetical protein
VRELDPGGGGGYVLRMESNLVVVEEPRHHGKAVGKLGRGSRGVTGRGFEPGQTGNPEGGRLSRKPAADFSKYLQGWLEEQDFVVDDKGRRVKEVRLQTLVKRLAVQKPEVLLAYAYGKPVETHQHEGTDGQAIEFIVKVQPSELP